MNKKLILSLAILSLGQLANIAQAGSLESITLYLYLPGQGNKVEKTIPVPAVGTPRFDLTVEGGGAACQLSSNLSWENGQAKSALAILEIQTPQSQSNAVTTFHFSPASIYFDYLQTAAAGYNCAVFYNFKN